MAPEPKRRPGDQNPQGRSVSNPDWVAGGRGNDYGIARSIFAISDWWKRRKAIKARKQ